MFIKTLLKMHILIAEDDQDDQEIIKLALDRLDVNISLKMVENGQQALDYLSLLADDQLPCMAILDMNMPVMNGLQTLELMNAQQRCKQIPKVIFSTSDSADYKAKSLDHGAVDYVVKPLSLKEFVVCLDKMIDYCRGK
ncbi:response regulator [Dyadobacter alkalitolerans]|uniref:response regulator n=1 Tax=Dyadobacter alkalitolerans TaxID=492736 RepID=UPI0006857149|nr:response regulator [Dyadobacter alkalitolerans]